MKRWTLLGALALAFSVVVGVAAASTPGADVRLTHDANDPGYISSYTIATGTPYTDATLNRLAELNPQTLAIMHGSTFRGNGREQILGLASALKELIGPNQT